MVSRIPWEDDGLRTLSGWLTFRRQVMNPSEPITPRWLTLKGAARYSGLSERTIVNYIKDGLIVSSNVIRPGASRGRRLVDRISLDAFIEAQIGKTCEIAMNRHRQPRRRRT
jgi:hypothetical protein